MLWKLFFTKDFCRQFLNLPTDKQKYVVDTMDFLRDILDVDRPVEFDIVDEYSEEASKPAERFPITYHIAHGKEELYFISIEESFRTSTK